MTYTYDGEYYRKGVTLYAIIISTYGGNAYIYDADTFPSKLYAVHDAYRINKNVNYALQAFTQIMHLYYQSCLHFYYIQPATDMLIYTL